MEDEIKDGPKRDAKTEPKAQANLQEKQAPQLELKQVGGSDAVAEIQKRREFVSIGDEELKKVDDAVAALASDPHAPRSVTITLTIHIHNEYPKILYMGKETRSVADADEEASAGSEGFGPYDHQAFTAKEE